MQPVNSPHSPYGMCRTVMKVSLSYFDYHNHNHNCPILNIFIIKKNTSNLSFCRTPCLGNTQMLASTPLLPHLATPRIRKLCACLCLCVLVYLNVFSPCVYLGWPMFFCRYQHILPSLTKCVFSNLVCTSKKHHHQYHHH